MSGRDSNIGNVHDARRFRAGMDVADLKELHDLAVRLWDRAEVDGGDLDLHAVTRGMGRLIGEVERLRNALNRSFVEQEELKQEANRLRGKVRELEHECKPSQWAYDQAVIALNRQRDKASRLGALMERIAELIAEEGQ